jgi:streptogramin lyase
VIDGNHVWFTERGANRIGRLDITTDHIDEFYDHGLSPNAGLADIKVAPDGRVWTTGQWSNRLVALTITSTTDYAFREYTHTFLISPFGLAIRSSDDIWVAAPGAHRIGWFEPSTGQFYYAYGIPTDSAPTELVYFFFDVGKPHSEVWFSDLQKNSVGCLLLSTMEIIEYFGPFTRPTGLASESTRVFWVTQQDERGAIGRLAFTDVLSTQIDSYPLPTSGLLPTGIAVAPDRSVWLAAYMPDRVYLPIISQNGAAFIQQMSTIEKSRKAK